MWANKGFFLHHGASDNTHNIPSLFTMYYHLDVDYFVY